MKLRILLVIVALLVVAGALGGYVALTAGRELVAARSALRGAPQSLEGPTIDDARAHLQKAVDHLSSPPARILGAVPLLRQNVGAARAVSEATIPVLSSALDIERRLRTIEERGLMRAGAVRVELIGALEEPLADEARALAGLEATIQDHRTGWLLPPLWAELDEQLERIRSLRSGAEGATEAARMTPDMLGAGSPRTYLVLMLNNAELRGAGGILSGVGTLSVDDGRIALGNFFYYRDIADDPPYRRVPAPEDFASHFKRYDAATTRWVATSSSPDVPDVALVASRLYRLSRGIRTDGALIADARGLSSLMPPRARIEVSASDTVLTPEELPDYIYSRAYEELTDQRARRTTLVDVGATAFETVLKGGLGGRRGWTSMAEAVAGGHLRFVSFDPSEYATLEHLGIAGELGAPEDDGMLVTVQNFGANKFDYWARRRVRHGCELDPGSPARCATEVRILNRVPLGLPKFVYQERPYGVFENYLEVYVPRAARLTGVEVDGRAVRYNTANEDGYKAIGTYVEVPRGEDLKLVVSYDLDLDADGYSLEARPQPLAHDAHLAVAVTVPPGWAASGLGTIEDGVLSYSGDFDRALSWEVRPDDRTGIPALWASVTRFWREPLL